MFDHDEDSAMDELLINELEVADALASSDRRDPVSVDRIATVLRARCCSHACLLLISVAAACELITERLALPTKQDKLLWLRMAIRHGKIYPTASKRLYLLRFIVRQSEYFICAKGVALLCRCSVHQVYDEIRNLREDKDSPPITLPRVPRELSPAHRRLVAWIKNFVEENGQLDPQSDKIFMPVKMTHVAMYDAYRADMEAQAAKHLGISTLRNILSSSFSNLSFPHSTGLGKCSTCFALLQAIKAEKNWDAKKVLKKEHLEHVLLARAERTSYIDRQVFSANLGNRAMSITFDGASALQFPFVWPPPRALTNHPRLPILLYGSTNHTFRRRRLYLSPDGYTHDANYVLTVLAHEIVCALASNPTFDPHTLHLQADNCVSQNKNKYLIVFIALLLKLGYFKDAYFHFMTVGHTHDDQDAVFGLLISQLRNRHTSAATIPDLIAEVTQEVNGKRLFKEEEFVKLGGLWDFKSYINNLSTRLESFTHYRSFHLRATHDGVRMCYRESSDDSKPWIGDFNTNSSVLILHTLGEGSLTPAKIKQSRWERVNEIAANLIPQLQICNYTAADIAWFEQFRGDASACTLFTAPPEACLDILKPRVHPEQPAPRQRPPHQGPAPVRGLPPPSLETYMNHRAVIGDLVMALPDSSHKKLPQSTFMIGRMTGMATSVSINVQWYLQDPITMKYSPGQLQTKLARSRIMMSGFELLNDMVNEALALKFEQARNRRL